MLSNNKKYHNNEKQNIIKCDKIIEKSKTIFMKEKQYIFTNSDYKLPMNE